MNEMRHSLLLSSKLETVMMKNQIKPANKKSRLNK